MSYVLNHPNKHSNKHGLDESDKQRFSDSDLNDWQQLFANVNNADEVLQLLEKLSIKSLNNNTANLDSLMALARHKRDAYWQRDISYSPKVFLPLTQLCRDVCHYCTFAKTPKKVTAPYMTLENVLRQARQADAMGCKEALLTLGEKPELRYNVAAQWLKENGFKSTIDYVAFIAQKICQETNLLPHINAGCLTADEYQQLKKVSASMGLMLETSSSRLSEKGQPHYGSPDKDPELRLQSIALAGQEKVPFTSGILVGIGETLKERIESLLALRDLHLRYDHLQEVIVQNFCPKEQTKMANAAQPQLEEFQQAIALARLLLPEDVSVQAPPNLSANNLSALLNAGINDWGGVSPITQDFVNPEAPWPAIEKLKTVCLQHQKSLLPRLTVYPKYIQQSLNQVQVISSNDKFLDKKVLAKVLQLADSRLYAKEHQWLSGVSEKVDVSFLNYFNSKERNSFEQKFTNVSEALKSIFEKIDRKEPLNEQEIVYLFNSRGDDYLAICAKANGLREQLNGSSVSYVLNRNINYTNICTFSCSFCAFSKGSKKHQGKEAAYDLRLSEIIDRAKQAWQQGATEVCLQGGIHPDYTGQTYIDICAAIKAELPEMHIHAFSPLEVTHGAETLNLSITEFLKRLQQAGLNTLPGTAAEILDDEVRDVICADKLNTEKWLEVMRCAHKLGLRTTATMMFGHVEQPQHWARHLIRLRDLQIETQGFTEFVPLPFVAAQAPMFLQGSSRRGPDISEAVLVHAVSRLVLSPWIKNIQASWVKMGEQGVQLCLQAGANDLGGSLMNESITRAAGAQHGQCRNAQQLRMLADNIQRPTHQRNTVYDSLSATLSDTDNGPLKKNVDTLVKSNALDLSASLINSHILHYQEI